MPPNDIDTEIRDIVQEALDTAGPFTLDRTQSLALELLGVVTRYRAAARVMDLVGHVYEMAKRAVR